MEEVWKSVIGYEGLYQISNLGRMKKLDELILFSKDEDNYSYINLKKLWISNTKSVHRLVAQLFIQNPNNYPVVNHINGIKNDNRVENLEWCTHKYNSWHSWNILGHRKYYLHKGRSRDFIDEVKTINGVEIHSFYQDDQKYYSLTK